MKIAALLIVFASPALAQGYAVRASDKVPTRADLSDTILDRDLEYFDGGISRYDTGGAYAWTYSDMNGGGVLIGIHSINDDATVCVTYEAGAERCDMFVISGERLVLLTGDGQRFPLREIR